VVVVLYSRFEVFYCTLPPWLWWLLDRSMQLLLTFKANVLLGDDMTRILASKDGTSIITSLAIDLRRKFNPRGGHYFFIQVPAIDSSWHPFSVATMSSDRRRIQLIIRARGATSLAHNPSLGEVEAGLGPKAYKQDKGPESWTFRLSQLISNSRNSRVNMSVNLRGPYGSNLSLEDDSFLSVVCGTGTGIARCLPLLLEFARARHEEYLGRGMRSQKKLWLIWSCKDASELLHCWTLLKGLLLEHRAAFCRPVSLGRFYPESSNMADWLGIRLYVTQADPHVVQTFLELEREYFASNCEEAVSPIPSAAPPSPPAPSPAPLPAPFVPATPTPAPPASQTPELVQRARSPSIILVFQEHTDVDTMAPWSAGPAGAANPSGGAGSCPPPWSPFAETSLDDDEHFGFDDDDDDDDDDDPPPPQYGAWMEESPMETSRGAGPDPIPVPIPAVPSPPAPVPIPAVPSPPVPSPPPALSPPPPPIPLKDIYEWLLRQVVPGRLSDPRRGVRGVFTFLARLASSRRAQGLGTTRRVRVVFCGNPTACRVVREAARDAFEDHEFVAEQE
jgi:NAD(P)H-flavin reductase